VRPVDLNGDNQMQCENCGRDFNPQRSWQRFCDKQCQQAWNRHRYRMGEVLGAEYRRETNGNSNANVDDAHRAKWAAIRAEWADEDRQEAQQQRRFLRRY